MNTTLGFEQFYISFWQQPILLGLAALAALLFIAVKGKRGTTKDDNAGFSRSYLMTFGIIAFCDAWLTANEVIGLGTLPASAAMVVPILFVFLGDLRFFWLTEKFRPGGKAALAVVLSAIVPCLSALAQKGYPLQWQTPRFLFLTYEVMFLGLLLFYFQLLKRAFAQQNRQEGGQGIFVLRRLRVLTISVALYYGLWALSDTLILGLQLDTAFGLRTLANILYYGGFMIMASRCLSDLQNQTSLEKK